MATRYDRKKPEVAIPQLEKAIAFGDKKIKALTGNISKLVDEVNATADFIEVYGINGGATTRNIAASQTWYTPHNAGNWNYRSKGGVAVAPVWAEVPDKATSIADITIKEKGWYEVHYQVYFVNGFTAGDSIASCVLLNYMVDPTKASHNLRYSRGVASKAAAYTTIGGSCIVPCQEGDKLRLAGENVTGARGTISLSSVSRMLIRKLGSSSFVEDIEESSLE